MRALAKLGLGFAWAGLIAASAVPSAQAKEPFIIMVSGPLIEPFFGPLKKGADDAAKALGVEYQYSTIQDFNNVQADLTRLVQQAAARRPDVLVVSDFFPDSMGPQIKKAAASGIPVIIMDGGYESWRDVGGQAYVGYDSHLVGAQAGDLQSKAGVKHGLCVNQVPGNPALEAMCRGYVEAIKAGGGDAKTMTIPLQDTQNPQVNLQAIKGALAADVAIDGVYALGPTQVESAIRAVDEAGRTGKVEIGGLTVSRRVLEAVRDGKAMFVVDLQGYLDGYFGLTMAYQKAKFDMLPAEPIFAAPHFILQGDAQHIIDVNKEYAGYRGVE
ncbi:monosaccharide ABC transporter substrate-binding protein (CUT2 family) [Roseiarcus fermentans]|uniref:Monosaccharide ABC transporter substrate-binding protein (CUT2 family) n=1 Tax=Roseiarcus fermentans TaxID=1473586 RepID=A0A366F7F0_9HYPH|nr:substrate-binding domain-containing protein [Roseiarcus fermentans]RBP10568.1 monosaccharide ABC transporter substrate-binding protein (CUT2 family) [Roseiarcus fermentans]